MFELFFGDSRSLKQPIDSWLVGSLVVLLGMSILMVYSTTAIQGDHAFSDPGAVLKQHLLHLALGSIALVFLYRLNPLIFDRYSKVLLLSALILLGLVLIPGIGKVAGGARRWLAVGPVRFQPSEFVKALLVCYFASYIGRHHAKLRLFLPGVLVPFTIIAVVAMLLLLEPDFGATAVICLVIFFQLFTVARTSYLFGSAVIGLGALALLVVHSAYRYRRFQMFLDPFKDPAHSGYQLIQSLIAVGSGGMFGVGLGAGKQKLFYLPAAHTDFIFAVIAEELGLLGAALVVLVFLVIAFRGLYHARRLENNLYLSTLTLGITLLLVVPALLNMSVVVGILPTKGMVLPLVAYGGSATVVDLALVGMLLRLSRMEA